MIFPLLITKRGEFNFEWNSQKACGHVNQGRPAGGGIDKGCQATTKAYSSVTNPGLELESTHFYICYCILAVTGQI